MKFDAFNFLGKIIFKFSAMFRRMKIYSWKNQIET